MTDDLVEFVKAWESLKLKSSGDPLVPGIYDVGYGHVIHASDHLMTITREQAHEMLITDLQMIAEDVRAMVTVPVLEHELEALIAFAYNVGINALRKSTLLSLLNSADYDGASGQFARWNKAGGRMIRGLVKRRAAERAMFEMADYTGRP